MPGRGRRGVAPQVSLHFVELERGRGPKSSPHSRALLSPPRRLRAAAECASQTRGGPVSCLSLSTAATWAVAPLGAPVLRTATPHTHTPVHPSPARTAQAPKLEWGRGLSSLAGCGGGGLTHTPRPVAPQPRSPPARPWGPRAQGQRPGQGLNGCGSWNCAPGVPRGARAPSRGVSVSANTNNNKRKESPETVCGERRTRVLHVGGREPPRVPASPPAHSPEGSFEQPPRGLAPTFEVRDDPVQLRVDRGVRHGGWRAWRRAEGGGEEAPPAGPGPCALAGERCPPPAVQSWPPEPLAPRARLNEWGRRAGAGAPRSPPRPRLPGGSGSRTLGPASPSRTGCRARLSRPGLGGLGPEWPPRGRRSSGRLSRAPLFCSGAHGAAPSPDAPRRPDVGGCGGGAEGGSPPLPWGARFLLREVLWTQPNKVRRRLPALGASEG